MTDRWFRAALLTTELCNLIGALIFMPPFEQLRVAAGLPEPGHPLFGWIVSLWILFFGIAYMRLAFSTTPERLFVQVGAAGKTSFALVLMAFWLVGDLPWQAAITGLPDLFFAAVFLVWLYQTRHTIGYT